MCVVCEMVGSEQQRQQFCCLIPDIFKYENRCIILFGKKKKQQGLDGLLHPSQLSAGRVGRLHQRSGIYLGDYGSPLLADVT